MRPKINLNKETKKRILNMYRNGKSMQEIAKVLKVKVIWILDLLNGKKIPIRKIRDEEDEKSSR